MDCSGTRKRSRKRPTSRTIALMRIPSRVLPKYTPSGMRWHGWAFLAVMASGAVWLLVTYPLVTTACIAGFAALTALLNRRYSRKLASLSASREGESICQFARSFDCRNVDTWIIRAAYEALQDYHRKHGSLPIRATDHLEHDLLIDDEELDLAIAPVIAARSGRSMERPEENPYFGKVKSVADLVMFFNEQPRDAGTSAQSA
jgi:hypothetical protein